MPLRLGDGKSAVISKRVDGAGAALDTHEFVREKEPGRESGEQGAESRIDDLTLKLGMT
jgi:hypothetical protein